MEHYIKVHLVFILFIFFLGSLVPLEMQIDVYQNGKASEMSNWNKPNSFSHPQENEEINYSMSYK